MANPIHKRKGEGVPTPQQTRLQRVLKRLQSGLLVAIPALVTFWVIELTLELAVASGEPLARILAGFVRPIMPGLADLLLSDGLRWAVAIGLMTALIYVLGSMAGEISGRRLLDRLEKWVLGIPGIDLIYGGVRDLVTSIKKDEFEGSRVVLIEFPGPHMKAIGFVTRTLQDRHTGEPLAAVYVPTTPNPTSGYIEIVPTARLVWLDWTPQQAMRFVVSGGVAGPETIVFSADAPIRLPGPVAPVAEDVPSDAAAPAASAPDAGIAAGEADGADGDLRAASDGAAPRVPEPRQVPEPQQVPEPRQVPEPDRAVRSERSSSRDGDGSAPASSAPDRPSAPRPDDAGEAGNAGGPADPPGPARVSATVRSSGG